MIFGAPVVGDVIFRVPADPAISAVDDLQGDESGWIFGIEGDVCEESFVAPFGLRNLGLGAKVNLEFAWLCNDFPAGLELGEFTLGDLSDGELLREPIPVEGAFDRLCFCLCSEGFIRPPF